MMEIRIRVMAVMLIVLWKIRIPVHLCLRSYRFVHLYVGMARCLTLSVMMVMTLIILVVKLTVQGS